MSVKNKVLELLGYEGFAGARDLAELNRARAGEENPRTETLENSVKRLCSSSENSAGTLPSVSISGGLPP